MKRVYGFLALSVALFILGFIVLVAFVLIAAFVDFSAIYGLILSGLLLIIGFVFLYFNRIEYNDEIVILKPHFKKQTVKKEEIREIYSYMRRSRYSSTLTVILNLEGKTSGNAKTDTEYAKECKEAGMERIITFYISSLSSKKDLEKIFASHESLLAQIES